MDERLCFLDSHFRGNDGYVVQTDSGCALNLNDTNVFVDLLFQGSFNEIF